MDKIQEEINGDLTDDEFLDILYSPGLAKRRPVNLFYQKLVLENIINTGFLKEMIN